MNPTRLAVAAILTTCLIAGCGSGEGGNGQSGNAPAPTPAPAPADTTPPTPPANLIATPIASAKVRLTWAASSDNVGVAGYRIYRDGAIVGSTVELFFEDAGLAASTPYAYRVAAFDAAQNASPPSSAVSATRAAAGGSDGGLLLAGDLEYVGAFRLPTGSLGCAEEHCTFAFGGSAISYNPQNNSLFMMGHRHGNRIAEVNIPALVNSSNVGNLNVATVRQSFADLALGQVERIGTGAAVVSNANWGNGSAVNGPRLSDNERFVLSRLVGFDPFAGGHQSGQSPPSLGWKISMRFPVRNAAASPPLVCPTTLCDNPLCQAPGGDDESLGAMAAHAVRAARRVVLIGARGDELTRGLRLAAQLVVAGLLACRWRAARARASHLRRQRQEGRKRDQRPR